MVVKSEYEPSNVTLKEDRDAILGDTYTSSSESNDDRTKKVTSKNKSNYDTPYDHSDPPPTYMRNFCPTVKAIFRGRFGL